MPPSLRSPFSPRERQVADLIGVNKSYREIAAALDLSVHTVRSFTVRMSAKIDFGREPAPEPRTAVYAYVIHERYVAREKMG